MRHNLQESDLRWNPRGSRSSAPPQPHPRRQGKRRFVYENGQGTLEDNDIFGNALSGVEIRDDTNPTLRGNRIHDGKALGVHVNENGQGTLEDNDIFGNERAGIKIVGGSRLTLRRNRINKNGLAAIWVIKGGGGLFEDNDLRENTRGAWDISDDSKPNVKAARNLE